MSGVSSCCGNMLWNAFVTAKDAIIEEEAQKLARRILGREDLRSYESKATYTLTHRGITVSVRYWTKNFGHDCCFEILQSPAKIINGETFPAVEHHGISKSASARAKSKADIETRIEEVFAHHPSFHQKCIVSGGTITYRESQGDFCCGLLSAVRWTILESPGNELDGTILDGIGVDLRSARINCIAKLGA